MKLLTATVSLLLLNTLSVLARSIPFFDSQSPLTPKELPIDGDNPLEYCADPTKYILEIERVDLSPNPPKPYASSPPMWSLLRAQSQGAIALHLIRACANIFFI